MNQNIKEFLQQGEKELIQKISEIEPSGFNVISPTSDNGYYLDEDKTKEWYRSSQISLIKMIVENILESLPDYKLNEGYMEYGDKKTFTEGWNMCKNEVRDTISSNLKDLIK